MKKRPGRPPSQATLEKRRVEAMMKNMPEHLPKLTEEEKFKLDESFAHDEKIRKEILRTYKHGITTPDNHAYDMASLGDESLIGHEQRILEADDTYAYRAKRYREKGAANTKDKNYERREALRGINQNLISRIRPNGRYTLHRVAQLIHDQWESMSPSQKFPGEESLSRRGDGHDRPSVITIGRWINP
jgi:hypothetical protein